jgi:hypothetical protein
VYNQKRMCGDDDGSSACGRETARSVAMGEEASCPSSLARVVEESANRHNYTLHYYTVRRRPVAENRNTNG